MNEKKFKDLSTAIRHKIEFELGEEWFDFSIFAGLCDMYDKKPKILHEVLRRLENEGKLECKFGLSEVFSVQKNIPSYRMIAGKSVIAITALQNKQRAQTADQQKRISLSNAFAAIEKWLLICTGNRLAAGIKLDFFGRYISK